MVEAGGGRSTLENLCACLNLPSPMAKEAYNDTSNVLKGAMEKEATASMSEAAELERSIRSFDRGDIIECEAMFDGTWRKRGHPSFRGTVTAISVETGECLDIETLNKIRKACSIWASKPDGLEKETCRANHKCPEITLAPQELWSQKVLKESWSL